MSILAKPLERFATNSLEAHWMPFTANRDFKAAPRLVTRSEGMYLWNQNGDRLIDGSSGLFNVAAGHGRREIAEAVYAQMLQNDYTAPFQLGQPTSFALAQNAISAGPIKTLAASGISGFSQILAVYRDRAPLRRNIETSEVADAAAFL